MFWGIVLAVVAVVALLLLPGIGISMLRKRSRILQTPLSKISSLQRGQVAVKGVVRPLLEYYAPFSGLDCVYCSFKASRMQLTEKGHVDNTWDTIYEGQTDWPFYVDDDHGRVLVDPRGAHIDLTGQYIYDAENYRTVGSQVKVSMPNEQTMATFDAEAMPYAISGKPLPLKCSESHLTSGTEVYLLGTCSDKEIDINHVVGDYRDALTETPRCVILGSGPGIDNLYLSPGNELSVPQDLLSAARWCIGVGSALGVTSLYFAIKLLTN